jgi:hypothetical protein
MTGGASRKVGWTWTRQGWKRIPRRLRQVKAVPLPSKRKTRKLRRIVSVEPKPEQPEATEAQNLAVEQGRADSAPILAPKSGQPAARQPRQAWGGKYADLTPPEAGGRAAMSKPPLTNPPPDLERGADYDTPQTYARIGRALMLFLFNVAHDPANKEHIAWLCAGANHVNGARLFDKDGFTHDPSAHPSHWMNPRGSWGSAEGEHDEEGSRHESAFYAPLGRTNGQHCLCRFDSWRLGLGRLAFAEAL